jgi:hypothetical protein
MTLPIEINRTIDQAIDHLRRERSAETSGAPAPSSDGLLFLGQWHDAYPTVLVRDPFLTDSAKIQWLYLAQEARRQPQGAIGMPSIQETIRALHQARGKRSNHTAITPTGSAQSFSEIGCLTVRRRFGVDILHRGKQPR